jgi:hypothetical protein
MMKSLLLSLATDPTTSTLLDNFEDIIGNILDVFVYRLKEIGERKFILHRLQSLDLGFSISFGLPEPFYPIRKARHFLGEALTNVSCSTARETVGILSQDVQETERLGLTEQGVTFHIIMEGENEASFISLPLAMQQTTYVSLLSSHTLRCNIIGSLFAQEAHQIGIFKIDAPTHLHKFAQHKGFQLAFEEGALLEKLGSNRNLSKMDFTQAEFSFIKLLFNEYARLSFFLLGDKRVDPNLKILILFPRLNIFKIIHEEKHQVPKSEPLTLGELAACHSMLFPLDHLPAAKKTDTPNRVHERILQERRIFALKALANSIIENIHQPLIKINKDLNLFMKKEFTNPQSLKKTHARLNAISSYLRKLQNIQRAVFDEKGKTIDLEASIKEDIKQEKMQAIDEIARDIQIAEIEQIKELSYVVISKMIDYLSYVTIKLELLEKVLAPSIKKTIAEEVQSYTNTILSQSKSFYRLVTKQGVK